MINDTSDFLTRGTDDVQEALDWCAKIRLLALNIQADDSFTKQLYFIEKLLMAQQQTVNEELLNALKDAVFLWDAEKSLINKDDINKWREVIKKAEQEHIYTAPDDLGTALRRLEDHYNILQEKKGQNHE